MNEDDKKEDFSLYTEKIVVNPSIKYKRLIKLGKLVASAAIFGVVAGVVISVTYPLLSDKWNIGNKQKLTISKDEYSADGATTEDGSEQDASASDDSSSEKSSETIDYNSIVSTLLGNVENIQKSIVAIDTYRTSVGDFISDTQSATETVGLVVGEVNSRYLVLTNYSAITDSASIVVKLSSATEINAVLLGKDEASNLAVVSIKESDVPSNERTEIEPAMMDNSYKVKQGDMVIAAGKLYGQVKAVDYGVVTNTAYMSKVDNMYEILETGLTTDTGDYCFLFNSAGNIIGVSAPGMDGTVKVIGISDVKMLIETLSNGEKNRYIGIKGQNVTSTMSVKYTLPMGIYITQVEMDSPAFTAGLQTGDVITGIDGNMVLTIQAFSEKLYQCTSGQSMALTVKRLGKDGYKEIVFTVTIGEK